jgi:formylglycine-generating enzyme required for sulfatase activity
VKEEKLARAVEQKECLAPKALEPWDGHEPVGQYAKRNGLADTLSITLREDLSLVLALIPPGACRIGSPATEEQRGTDEAPHVRTFPHPFYMSIFEITQGQYELVMGENPSSFRGKDLPVEQVTWFEAQAFAERLGSRAGGRFRLPTEPEWEYACRAGTGTAFSCGANIHTGLANYNGEYIYGGGPEGVYRRKTTPVGSFARNALGLYDLHGNVCEWCLDEYDPEYRIRPSGLAGRRVMRGGSWMDSPRSCRSAARLMQVPGNRNAHVGFRVVMEP